MTEHFNAVEANVSAIPQKFRWQCQTIPSDGSLANHTMNLVTDDFASGQAFLLPFEESDQILEFAMVFPSTWDVVKSFSISTAKTSLSCIVEEGTFQLESGKVNVLCFVQLDSTQIAICRRVFG